MTEGTEYAGLNLTSRSLRHLRGDLEQQLVAARRSEVELHLSGQPVLDHEIRIDKLAQFLGRFQESVAAIAQALAGKATSRAPIPANLRDASSLRLAGVFPGSFGATLRGPEENVDDGVLFELPNEDVESLLDLSLKRILSIVDAVHLTDGSDEETIVELVAPLGSRALRHVTWLAKLMADDELDAEWIWTAPGSSSKYSALSSGGARRLYRVLSNNEATEEAQVVRGLLGGASEIRNRIELQLATGEIINARVADDVVAALRDYFGSEVNATFNVRTVTSRTSGIVRNYYLLTDLEYAIPPGQQPS
ncbi:hypothetical protein [Actinomycetospora chibensis]|uniref:Uncharacterized protein n=1 Tax=Actinomycetospora chibensis TaxID=663606 RepID=A0ABV9RRF1_9PSEU|nr:hypothetical protein [Actinomycetospora chibensis]MDD7922735.1 hypothetical protein [Actinomycetospora chibensis]